jgi:predicted nucleotidyltransferase
MNLFGMHEAYQFRTPALLPGGVAVDVPTVAGLAVLKIVAWTDRRHTTRRDASDLAEILDWQSQGELLDTMYLSAPERLERYEFDVDLAGANRLGAEMAVLMGVGAAQLAEAFPEASIGLLASHMPRTVVDRASMLRALFDGLSADV